jgi:hypothetical protein
MVMVMVMLFMVITQVWMGPVSAAKDQSRALQEAQLEPCRCHFEEQSGVNHGGDTSAAALRYSALQRWSPHRGDAADQGAYT